MSLSRRRFLWSAGGAAASAAVGTGTWAALLRDTVEGTARPLAAATTPTTIAAKTNRILVVVQQNGGNDALNTLVPIGDGRYHDARSRIALAESDVIALAGTAYALHPAFAPLVAWWERENLAFIPHIGFEDQTRSHFASMALWGSGLPGTTPTTGWLGRWLDATGDGSNPLRGISLGQKSLALAGETIQSTFVADPATFALLAPPGANPDQLMAAFLAAAEPLSSDPLHAAAQRAIPSTFEALDIMAAASEGVEQEAQAQPGVESLLRSAAGLVALDVGTQVIVIGTGGFDTHANQLAAQAPLLADVAAGITSFLAEMERQGRSDDVLVVTTTEFGRRVNDNATGGTDHGAGGTLLACGPAVKGQLAGEIDLGQLVEGDLRIATDTRALYQVCLEWLGGPTEDVLGGTFGGLELV